MLIPRDRRRAQSRRGVHQPAARERSKPAASGPATDSDTSSRATVDAPLDQRRRFRFDARGCGAATCAPLGRFKLGSPANGQPVVAGDVLYAGTRDGRLLAFATRGCGTRACTPLWSVDAGGGAIVSGPIVIDGSLYAGTADGQIVAYGLPDA
jgi:outer membrane protein assembly factor BamB